MRRIKKNLAVLALVCWGGLAVSEESVQILQVGLWHGEEVSVQGSSDWWGIFPEGDGFTLESAPITITPERDEIAGDGPDQKSGRRVSIPQEAEPLFLVKGLKNPVPGTLRCLMEAPPYPYLQPGETRYLRMRDEKNPDPLRLSAIGEAKDWPELPGRVAVFNYQFKLYRGYDQIVVAQALPPVRIVSEDSPPRLIWAGDLDRDGKIDLLMDLTHDYNLTHLALFLSSAAKEGAFVGLVAEWKTVGC
jgi:hypothetical protein